MAVINIVAQPYPPQLRRRRSLPGRGSHSIRRMQECLTAARGVRVGGIKQQKKKKNKNCEILLRR